MISILRPGEEPIQIEFILLDFEGTLATDRRVHPKAKDKINLIAKHVKIYILTSGEKEKIAEVLRKVKAEVLRLSEGEASREKITLLHQLGPHKVAAIGNGADDISVVEEAALGIAIMNKEGTSSELIRKADLVFMNILDALDFFLRPLRQKATLGR